MEPEKGSLRDRKRRRAREAIIAAAHELFAERGFDGVTVADIAERAEVGRATFFRHFGDKQEVVFGATRLQEAARAESARAEAAAPIGDSLDAALSHLRDVVVTFARRLTEHPDAFSRHERLVAAHPELRARSLTKQRRYAETLYALLLRNGAGHETATLAAEIGVACYHAGHTLAEGDPERLAGAVDAAFERLRSPGA
ncbi:TetR/AcrR family transcriptional regulator [Actinomadura viridis]|uniref:AcrR family transcriptional regulator n=1 Tax=Actinomadura viridis TaxID=58110 RepID=A0A931DP40_9ACTN|nr:TetR/AcrR family transcriptional regulator [Actinomadura viridis]MBG6091186.1 AcrR family transcriptional regulator [Actinomadura viridis]